MYELLAISGCALLCFVSYRIYLFAARSTSSVPHVFVASMGGRPISFAHVLTKAVRPASGSLVFDDAQGVLRAEGDVLYKVSLLLGVVPTKHRHLIFRFKIFDSDDGDVVVPVLILVSMESVISFESLLAGRWYSTESKEWAALVGLTRTVEAADFETTFKAECAKTLQDLGGGGVVAMIKLFKNTAEAKPEPLCWQSVQVDGFFMSAAAVREALTRVGSAYGYHCVGCSMSIFFD